MSNKQYTAFKPSRDNRTYDDRFEQDGICSFKGEEVTLVITKRGIVTCRSRKKCKHFGVDLGAVACPVNQAIEMIHEAIRDMTGR